MTFLQVEHHFYIPRLSQNWIIGTRLVKGTDMNKSLRDFDIRGSGVGGGGVSVFMYVMHTKKAQVPNEAARVRQQHVQHRQQQQQDLTQQSTQVCHIIHCYTIIVITDCPTIPIWAGFSHLSVDSPASWRTSKWDSINPIHHNIISWDSYIHSAPRKLDCIYLYLTENSTVYGTKSPLPLSFPRVWVRSQQLCGLGFVKMGVTGLFVPC